MTLACKLILDLNPVQTEDRSIKKTLHKQMFLSSNNFFCCKVKLNWIFLGINESPYLVTPKDSVKSKPVDKDLLFSIKCVKPFSVTSNK